MVGGVPGVSPVTNHMDSLSVTRHLHPKDASVVSVLARLTSRPPRPSQGWTRVYSAGSVSTHICGQMSPEWPSTQHPWVASWAFPPSSPPLMPWLPLASWYHVSTIREQGPILCGPKALSTCMAWFWALPRSIYHAHMSEPAERCLQVSC